MSPRPNVLVILTDQLRHPPSYEPAELAEWRRANCPGQERLRANGISFTRHYVMATACAPSRASLLTGQYPSLHGVTQTDGLARTPESPGISWLAPDGVPTLGDWFRAAGYRTYYKGKWHVSHAVLEDDDGLLRSIDDDGTPQPQGIARYLEADLLDDFGFSEWVGPEPHGLGRHNMGLVKDVFTADETIDLLRRLGAAEDDAPWLTVCSFLNPHDVAYFGAVGLRQGFRYGRHGVPRIPQAPTRHEDLSTKPRCQQSMVDLWGRLAAPQPFIQAHLRFYYQLQAKVDEQLTRVLDALETSAAAANTIVVFSSDHGDMQGAHGGLHQKWHNAYDESLRVPFVISSPLLPGGERELTAPTSHADLIPTLLGLAGIDPDATLDRLRADHAEAQPLVGRDLADAVRAADAALRAEPVLFTTDDEISEGDDAGPSPIAGIARRLKLLSTFEQPNHIETVVAEVEVDGAAHLVKFSRYHDNQQFWTLPGERDERLRGRRTLTVTEPDGDEFELYDLTLDPAERRNLAHPANADDRSRALQAHMLALLIEQLDAKRLTPATGERPGYRPPAAAAPAAAG
jgi:arylsulfatase A-like enzyme